MKIYEKLIIAREKIAAANLKKSGKSKNHTYFELEDINPAITRVCRELKLLNIVNFKGEEAILTILDLENNEKLEFTSPMPKNHDSKIMSEIQNIGASETYQRRYLLILAYDINDSDPNESNIGDLSVHNIFKIQERIQKAITEKHQAGIQADVIYKKIGMNKKELADFMELFPKINKIEKAVSEMKHD